MKKPLLLLLALFSLATGFGQSAAGDGPHKQLIIRGVTFNQWKRRTSKRPY
jgi:hypothetical protein